jgi:hypothetical protein
MPLPRRAWDAQLRAWASRQAQPFTLREAVHGARLRPANGRNVDTSTVRRALIRIGYSASSRVGKARDQPITWWRKAPPAPPPSFEARIREILALRRTIDESTAGLVTALEAWELELVARQDPPPPPPPPPMVDTTAIFEAGRAQGRQEREAEIPPPPPVVDREAVFCAGQQEGRQQRETEILALLGQQLYLLPRGTQGFAQLWALKNTITGSNE